MKVGFDIHRRSSVRSFLVGLSMTCVIEYGHLKYQVNFGAGMDLVYLIQLMEYSSQCGLD